MKTILVTAAALIDPDGRVLLAQRPAGKPMAGLWEFPGGKVEEKENPEACLVRELEEELTIETSPSCLSAITFVSHRYYQSPPPAMPQVPGLCQNDPFVSWDMDIKEDFHLLMLCYAIRRWKGIVAPREGQQIKWLRPKEMHALPMPPADKPVVQALIGIV